MPAVADYISSIDVSELCGLVHGAAAGGAEHVSACGDVPLPPPRALNPQGEIARARPPGGINMLVRYKHQGSSA